MSGVSRLAGTAMPYLLSIALAKGLSLALVPWIAAHLAPAEYGRIEIVGSIVEFLGLLFASGLADTLFRFCGSAESDEMRRRNAAAFAGSAIAAAAISALALQAMAAFILESLPVALDGWVFRLSLLAASVGGMIELPLAWLRLRDRGLAYLGFCALRAGLQFAAVGTAVWLAPRAESVLAATAIVEVIVALALVVAQCRDTGLRVTRNALRWAAGYNLPLILASVATFAVGSFDRWFLMSQVTAADLGQYGIASKVALATSLIMQPFGLWWYARRLRVLAEPDGLQRSAEIISIGFVILIVGAAFACLAGPAFVRLALPPGYLPAIGLIPGLVVISFLNESASLLNVGCYARRTSWVVTFVNLVGAIVAVAGYCLLIPAHGVAGAITATQAAHFVRIVGFLTVGHSSARIPYATGPILALLVTAASGVVLAARLDGTTGLALTIALPAVLAGLGWAAGLLRPLAAPRLGA